jgi:hypothetical protein
VAKKLLQLLAIVLRQSDENQLAQMNDFAKRGEGVLRNLKYAPSLLKSLRRMEGFMGGAMLILAHLH